MIRGVRCNENRGRYVSHLSLSWGSPGPDRLLVGAMAGGREGFRHLGANDVTCRFFSVLLCTFEERGKIPG